MGISGYEWGIKCPICEYQTPCRELENSRKLENGDSYKCGGRAHERNGVGCGKKIQLELNSVEQC